MLHRNNGCKHSPGHPVTLEDEEVRAFVSRPGIAG
jgi:hypothetical protein